MEPEEVEGKKKKLNDDLVVFMRKRSEHEAPRYTGRLKTYLDIFDKSKRCAHARRNTEKDNLKHEKKASETKNKEGEPKDKALDNTTEKGARVRSRSGSGSQRTAPLSDRGGCGCSRRRRRRRRRGRSCARRRRRRRRRSCGRRRRRRRRSCGRRRRSRRRRSCRRRRSRSRRRRSCRRRRRRSRRC